MEEEKEEEEEEEEEEAVKMRAVSSLKKGWKKGRKEKELE